MIEPGYIGVQSVPNASWFHRRDAWLIQIGTRSRYNHTAIVRVVDGNRIQVIEAAGGGVRLRWINGDDPIWIFANPGLTYPQLYEMVTEALCNIGFPYDYRDIAKFIVRFWTGKIPRRTKPDYADDRVICSELVAWCLHKAGVDPWPDRAYGAVSPGDIADYLFQYLVKEGW